MIKERTLSSNGSAEKASCFVPTRNTRASKRDRRIISFHCGTAEKAAAPPVKSAIIRMAEASEMRLRNRWAQCGCSAVPETSLKREQKRGQEREGKKEKESSEGRGRERK